MRSVSPEFECIDRIYEANVLAGNIQDTIGDFEYLMQKLKGESEIVLLGTERGTQDTYDLLLSNGIDICCFAICERDEDEQEVQWATARVTYLKYNEGRRECFLLGKPLISLLEAMERYEKPVFINCKDTHGALGEKWTEFFDYHGYERNKQYFLIKDYTDIPTSNLVHVLHNKKVWLTGDELLCRLLTEYLEKIENGEISVRNVSISQEVDADREDILCLVLPELSSRFHRDMQAEKSWQLKNKLMNMNFLNYTKYFICHRCFALIDTYLHKNDEKYECEALRPKGIALGNVPYYSGNEFLRGLLDGHPEILSVPYSDFNNNLFYYCIRLQGMSSEMVLTKFWELYNAEGYNGDFEMRELFDAEAKRLLGLKDKFTSQELFVLFHLAFWFMLDKRIENISAKTIYWEPHGVKRSDFPFLALWLEDENIICNMLTLRRNNVNRTCSLLVRGLKNSRWWAPSIWDIMFLREAKWDKEEKIKYKYCEDHKLRFEDMKTRPREMLMDLCRILHLNWSDSLMHTTRIGKPSIENGSVDFDLKSVFNKWEDYFSGLDWLKISIASSSYQKRYGYEYENCLDFSRKELQEMFLKPFLFVKKGYYVDDGFANEKERQIWLHKQLWEVRKHMVLDDIVPEFERFELRQTAQERLKEYEQNKLEKSIAYIKLHDKLILYGIGDACKWLLQFIDEKMKEKILYSDKKAEKEVLMYEGKNVIAPKELCCAYRDYDILVTSSKCRMEIKKDFVEMGIDLSRVYFNQVVI